jgi:murein hydrolase activator
MLSVLKTDIKIVQARAGLALCLVLSLPLLVWADTDISVHRQKQQIETRIDLEKSQISRFAQKERQVIEKLDDIDRRLNQAMNRKNALAEEVRDLEKTMAVIQADVENLDQRIRETEGYAKTRLAALYRLHMIGRLDMVGSPENLFDFFTTQHVLTRVVRSDFQVIETRTRDLARLQTLAAQLAEQTAVKDRLAQDLAGQVRIMEQETKKKQTLLDDIQHEKALSEAALAALKESAKVLDEKIQSFGKQTHLFEVPGIFSRQKGRLALPAAGDIVSRFGPKQSGDYKAFTFQSGIDIKVERGEPVRSVFQGKVIFAEWLKGYGNLVIINHGENYYTLYAHLQEMFKKKGDAVETGEVIATAGDTGSIKGVCLHFELRHHGKPVDPLKWIKKGA